ncbi:hypothetical protein ScPMuIL_002842 [Solemya velum]
MIIFFVDPPISGPVITGYSTGHILAERVPPATVTLTCTVGEANPEATIKWGSNCPAGTDSSSTNSITRMINVSRGMNGVVCTCSGSQSDTGWTGTDSVTFTVYFGPDSVTIGGVERVYTGESLTLSCDSTDANPGVTYQWRKNGVVVPGKTQQTLTSAYNRNDKTVSCTATNSFTSTTATKSTPLTVDYGPDRAEITRVLAGKQMTLTCTATSYSPGVIFQWTKKGTTVGDSSGTYKFTPQGSDDDAVVVCVAKNTQHLTKQKQVSATLNIPYSPSSGPTITRLPSQNLIEGRPPTTVTLTCTVGVANPVPTLTWNCPAGTDTSSTRSITRMIPVHRRIDGATCTCSGSQSDTGWSGSDSETFSVYYGTSNTSIQAPEVTTEGETVTISCSSLGNPAPTYTITGPRRTSNQDRLQIADIDRSDSGQYSCTAVNSYNSETRTVDVKVQYPPDVSVTYTNVTENDTAMVITCDAMGEPQTYNFSLWKHIGPDEHTDIRHLPGKQNGGQFTLTLNGPITYEDSGYYTCIVNNGIKGRSQQIEQTKMSGYFVVEGPPKILTKDNLIHGNLREEVDLVVEFYSVPGFTSVRWYSHDDGKQIGGNTHTETTLTDTVFHGVEVQVQGYRTSLTLNNVTESDFRSYRVDVGNTIGSASFGLILHGITDPCAARHIFIDTQTSTSITVTWSAGCNGGAEQTFYVQHRKSTSTADNIWETGSPILESQAHSYTINGLDPGRGYHIRVMSQNEKGETYTEYIGVRTLAPSEPTSEPVVETQTGPIVGGMIGVVVIVAVGLVIVVMWRKGLLKKGGLPCLQSNTDSDGIYQNQAFSPENQSKMDGVYQDLGPTENPSMHYEDLGGPRPADSSVYVNTEL